MRKRGKTVLNDSDKLALFLIRMHELLSRKYYQLAPVILDPTSVQLLQEVDEDYFAAFVLSFRHFWATNEPTEIGKIKNILQKGVKLLNDSNRASGHLERVEQDFQNSFQLGVDILDGTGNFFRRCTGEQIVHVFMNSRYFHADTEGFQFFYQLPARYQTSIQNVFRASLARYTERLKGYLPVVAVILESGIFHKGGFKCKIAWIDGNTNSEVAPDSGSSSMSIRLPAELMKLRF